MELRLGCWLCRFCGFESGILGCSWKWKADSYRNELSSKTTPDLNIYGRKFSGNEKFIEQKKVVNEKSGFFNNQVFVSVNGGTIWRLERFQSKEILLEYDVNKEWDQIQLVTDCTGTSGWVAFESLGNIISYAFIKKSVLTFHGVLMEYEGKGIIISAPSGTGKTTHARMWRDGKNALIINGDRASCYKKDGVWTGFGIPWSGTSGEQINRSVPLTAIVVLERGTKNKAHCIQGFEAFSLLFPHVQYPNWDVDMTERAMDLYDDFLESVPVIRLSCTPEMEAVDVLYEKLEPLIKS